MSADCRKPARNVEDLQTLIYIMITYKTLRIDQQGGVVISCVTHLTAGAKAERLTIAKPAARTAVACNNPSMTRTPTGIDSMVLLPISRRRKKNQSVVLQDKVQSCVEDCYEHSLQNN
jgi:hypothetical protein